MTWKGSISFMCLAAATMVLCDPAAANSRHHHRRRPIMLPQPLPPPVLPYPGLHIRPVPLPAPVEPMAPPTQAVPTGGICLLQQSSNGNGIYDLVLNQSQLLYQGYGPNVEEMLRYYESTGICRK